MPVEIPFRRDFSFGYGKLEPIAPGLRRIVARNPSPFTFHGTGTYVVGTGEVAVIDPGPDDNPDGIADGVYHTGNFYGAHIARAMDGLKLAAAVRHRWPAIEIIITTGKSTPQPHQMPAGSLFLPKPYRTQAVIEALRQL